MGMRVLRNTVEVREGLLRLQQIALRDDPLSHLDYIDQLIQAEKQEAKPGWQQRSSQLHNLRQQAEHLEQLKDPNFDPFARYSASAANAKKESSEGQQFYQGIKTNVLKFLHIV